MQNCRITATVLSLFLGFSLCILLRICEVERLYFLTVRFFTSEKRKLF
jgi:hypothetical protein